MDEDWYHQSLVASDSLMLNPQPPSDDEFVQDGTLFPINPSAEASVLLPHYAQGPIGFDGSSQFEFPDLNSTALSFNHIDDSSAQENMVEPAALVIELDDESIDGSGFNHNSDHVAAEDSEKIEESAKNGATGGGEEKGKKKGIPRKSLFAERRRRKKLNDKLYLLRSVVPNISKMDRASILVDAMEYMKEMKQKVKDLEDELQSMPFVSTVTAATPASFYPMTPMPYAQASSLTNSNCQPPRVEVRAGENGAVNIHMFCESRPGLLLSTMRTLEQLGLDVQQAVFSGYNVFVLDVFRAEQSREPGLLPEDIKAALLHSIGFPNAM